MKRALVVAATLSLLTACGEDSSQSDMGAPRASSQQSNASQTTTPQLTPAPFTARVEITNFSPECQRVKCWLPTQFEPKLVEKESVSLEEKATPDGKVLQTGWPNDDDQVEVLCITKGGSYQSLSGQLINDWYGIRVAQVDVEPKALTDPRLRKTPDGNGYLGFVGISWLMGGEGKQAPPC